ncbi:MAG: SRPBCC domain-containing protein [Cyclobacteriaceae bacterium]|nr:SRPBCC domain-containing protein [Cyclobacteriaceae bacterium]
MEQKTKIHAEDGRQELRITREFDLPLELLFQAYSDAEIVEQWMGTNVLKLENKNHGSYRFETTDPKGNKHYFSGTYHTYVPDRKIVRTFEIENSPFEPQLEFLDFESLTPETSKLTIQMIYRSVELRDQMLKLPFSQGINMAHNQLEKIVKNLTKKP